VGWLAPLTGLEYLLVWMFPLFFLGLWPLARQNQELVPFQSLWWVISFSLGALGPAFIRARHTVLERLLQAFVPQETTFHDQYRVFRHRTEQSWEGPAVSLFGGGSFIFFRFAASWESLDPLANPAYPLATLVFALGLANFVRSLWLFLVFGFLVNRMSLELEKNQDRLFSWELLEHAGKGYARTALGAALMSFCICWMALANLQLYLQQAGRLPGQLLLMEFLLALGVIVPLAYLFIPQWRLHRILVKRKDEIRALFYDQFLRIEGQFLKDPKRELAETWLARRQLVQEVERLPEWPFRFENLAPILTVVAVPAMLFLIKEIMVSVIIELIRKG